MNRIPTGHALTSLLGIGPMPFTKIVSCHLLVAEASRVTGDRQPTELTNAEDSLRRTVEARADRRVESAVTRTIEPAIAEITGVHAEAKLVAHQLDALDERPYVGPHGETLTGQEAAAVHTELREAVNTAERNGDKQHRRADGNASARLLALLCLDVLIMTFLLMRYFNVDFLTFWATPGGIVKATVALVFGILGTVGVVLDTKMFGRRHRPYRGPHGGWDFAGGARVMLVVELAVAVSIVLAIAGAMAWRFVLDGSDGDPILTALMATLFALVTGSVAYLSYQSEFADGSSVTEAIDALAGQLHATGQARVALAGKLEILTQQSARLLAKLHRDIETTRATATRLVLESSHDRAIRYARSIHQGTGHGGELPAPRLALGALELALAQAKQLDTTQANLAAQPLAVVA